MKTQKNKKCIVGKSEMYLKVPNHKKSKRNGAAINDKVRKLKTAEKHEAKKIEGGYRGLSQVSNTLANTLAVLLIGSSVQQAHHRRRQEERIDT